MSDLFSVNQLLGPAHFHLCLSNFLSVTARPRPRLSPGSSSASARSKSSPSPAEGGGFGVDVTSGSPAPAARPGRTRRSEVQGGVGGGGSHNPAGAGVFRAFSEQEVPPQEQKVPPRDPEVRSPAAAVAEAAWAGLRRPFPGGLAHTGSPAPGAFPTWPWSCRSKPIGRGHGGCQSNPPLLWVSLGHGTRGLVRRR